VLEVPYKGVNAEIPDLLAGVVMAAYVVPQVIVTHVKAGKLRALAVAGPHAWRCSRCADHRGGRPPRRRGHRMERHLRSAGTPPTVIQILHRELVRAYNAPDVKNQGGSPPLRGRRRHARGVRRFRTLRERQVEQGHPRCDIKPTDQAAPMSRAILAFWLACSTLWRRAHPATPIPAAPPRHRALRRGKGRPDPAHRCLGARRADRAALLSSTPSGANSSSAPKPSDGPRPDGYTAAPDPSSFIVNPSMYKKPSTTLTISPGDAGHGRAEDSCSWLSPSIPRNR